MSVVVMMMVIVMHLVVLWHYREFFSLGLAVHPEDFLLSAKAAAKSECLASWWVSNAQWAVHSMAILFLESPCDCIIVAGIAVVILTTTEEESNRAAVIALVVNEIGAMLVALGDTGAYHLGCTSSADEVLSASVIAHIGIILTVNKTTKVWLLALEALIEGALVDCVLLILSKVVVSWIRESLILVEALLSSPLHGHFSNLQLL